MLDIIIADNLDNLVCTDHGNLDIRLTTQRTTATKYYKKRNYTSSNNIYQSENNYTRSSLGILLAKMLWLFEKKDP